MNSASGFWQCLKSFLVLVSVRWVIQCSPIRLSIQGFPAFIKVSEILHSILSACVWEYPQFLHVVQTQISLQQYLNVSKFFNLNVSLGTETLLKVPFLCLRLI